MKWFPSELITLVAERVEDDDLKRFRLTCKQFAAASNPSFAKAFFTERRIPLTQPAMRRFLETTAHPGFSRYIQSVLIGDSQIKEEDSTGLNTQALLFAGQISRHDALVYDHIREVLEYNNKCAKAQKEYRNTQSTLNSLTHAFKELRKHNTAITIGTYHDNDERAFGAYHVHMPRLAQRDLALLGHDSPQISHRERVTGAVLRLVTMAALSANLTLKCVTVDLTKARINFWDSGLDEPLCRLLSPTDSQRGPLQRDLLILRDGGPMVEDGTYLEAREVVAYTHDDACLMLSDIWFESDTDEISLSSAHHTVRLGVVPSLLFSTPLRALHLAHAALCEEPFLRFLDHWAPTLKEVSLDSCMLEQFGTWSTILQWLLTHLNLSYCSLEALDFTETEELDSGEFEVTEIDALNDSVQVFEDEESVREGLGSLVVKFLEKDY